MPERVRPRPHGSWLGRVHGSSVQHGSKTRTATDKPTGPRCGHGRTRSRRGRSERRSVHSDTGGSRGALRGSRHGEACGAGEWPGQRQLLPRRPTLPGAPGSPTAHVGLRRLGLCCAGPARAPSSAWLPVQLRSSRSVRRRRGQASLSTPGATGQGPPKLALIPRRGCAPCPRCPWTPPPVP